MNTIYIDGDYSGYVFVYEGNVIIRGNFIIETDVIITGILMVVKDIFVGGNCSIETIQCSGDLNILGFLDCDKLHCSKSVRVGL